MGKMRQWRLETRSPVTTISNHQRSSKSGIDAGSRERRRTAFRIRADKIAPVTVLFPSFADLSGLPREKLFTPRARSCRDGDSAIRTLGVFRDEVVVALRQQSKTPPRGLVRGGVVS